MLGNLVLAVRYPNSAQNLRRPTYSGHTYLASAYARPSNSEVERTKASEGETNTDKIILKIA